MHLVIKAVLEVSNFKNDNLWTDTLVKLQKLKSLMSNLFYKYLVDLSINKTGHIFELNLKLRQKSIIKIKFL